MLGLTTIWIVFSLALVFSILLTPFSMYLAKRLGAVDVPCERSMHTVAVPRLGGVGICLSMSFAVALFLVVDLFSFGFLTGLIIIFMTGLLDDIRPLSHRFKFVGEILAASAFVGISGSDLSGLGNLFGFGEIEFGPLSSVITVFCMVGLINAMNLSDGLDGLAGGLAIIAALFFALLAYKAGEHNILVISLALAGSLLGFLLYNGFPAKLFMGDVGSLMIGYTCAALAVQIANAPADIMAIQPITIALILALPLLDTLIVMGTRILKGTSPFKPDKTHLHHKLASLGLSQNQVVSIMYALMIIYCSIAVLALDIAAYWQFSAAVALTVVVYRSITLLSRRPYLLISNVSSLSHRIIRIERLLLKSLFDVNRHYSRSVPLILTLLILVPLLFLEQAMLALMGLMPVVILSLLFFMRNGNQRVLATLQGLLYLVILTLLFIYYTSLGHSNWFIYWSVLISLCMGWIMLTLLVGHTRRMLSLHSFEILLILISWVAFFLVVPMMGFVPTSGEDVRVICVYAIPLLLIAKLCFGKTTPSFHGEMSDAVVKQL